MEYTDIVKLFDPPPEKWLFHGTADVWKDIKNHFEKSQGNITDKDGFKTKLRDLFKELTGHTLEAGRIVWIKEIDKNPGGGSSGIVSFTWWDKIGVPLLSSRFEENKAPYSGEKEFLDKIFPMVKKMVEKERNEINGK